MKPLSIKDPSDLKDKISSDFDMRDLKTLCFDLSIDFDNLSGDNKETKIIALISYLRRHDLLPNLKTYLKKVRPMTGWDDYFGERKETLSHPTNSIQQKSRADDPPVQQSKVLDAAIKNQIKVSESTIVLVLVRDSDSKGLRILLDTASDYSLHGDDVRSSRVFQLYYPVDKLGNLLPTDVEIVITSPDFAPPTQSKIIEVNPKKLKDSELDPIEFMLTPLRPGELQIIVEVYQKPEDVRRRIGSKPIRTVSKENPSPYAKYLVMSLLFHTTGIPQSTITNYYGDIVQGDKVGGDKVGGDKVGRDKTSVPMQSMSSRSRRSLGLPKPKQKRPWVYYAGSVMVLIVIIAAFFAFFYRDERAIITPTPTVTAVPPLKDAHVELLVTTGGDFSQIVSTDQSVTIAPNDAMLIDVLIITDTLNPTPEASDNYRYSYKTLYGTITEYAPGQVSYVAPTNFVPDTLTVRIIDFRTGEELVRNLSIEVSN